MVVGMHVILSPFATLRTGSAKDFALRNEILRCTQNDMNEGGT